MPERPRVGISRCLVGDPVRYDGAHKYEPAIDRGISPHVEWVPVCPEVEAGMAVPREPVHLVTSGGQSAVRLVGVETDTDWTGRMEAWAHHRLAALRALHLSGFVLKSRSPSCGLRDVPVRGGVSQSGMFAAMLAAAMPDLPLEDDDRLRDPAVRGAFLERVLAHHADLLNRHPGRSSLR